MKAGVGLLALVAIGCGDDGNKNTKADAAVPMIDAPPAMAMIGPEGGTIASSDGIATLTIPPNAVATATAFSIEAVPTAMIPAAVAAANPIGAVYDIQPEGTVFAMPATLTWTFASAPASTNDTMGRPKYILGYSHSATGEIEPHVETLRTTNAGPLTVTSQIDHLSTHLLSLEYQKSPTLWHEFGSVEMELGGGDYAVDTEWNVPVVAVHAADLFAGVTMVGSRQELVLPVTDISPPEWFESAIGSPEQIFYVHTAALGAGESHTFTPQARFKCSAAGMGKAAMKVTVLHVDFGDRLIVGRAKKTEDVNCIVRTEKPEYTAEVATLGAGRIAPAAVPSTQMADLTAQSGLYGYRVTLQPGQTIRVCVTTNGSTAVNYYPRYSPGYTFVDGNPGCTDITNLDTKNPNEVLIRLSGTGTDVDVVITTVP